MAVFILRELEGEPAATNVEAQARETFIIIYVSGDSGQLKRIFDDHIVLMMWLRPS